MIWEQLNTPQEGKCGKKLLLWQISPCNAQPLMWGIPVLMNQIKISSHIQAVQDNRRRPIQRVIADLAKLKLRDYVIPKIF